MSVGSHRRYCLLKAAALRARGEEALALAFLGKARELPILDPLPLWVPFWDRLALVGYAAASDFTGASVDELVRVVGLTRNQATAALLAIAPILSGDFDMGYATSNGTWSGTIDTTLHDGQQSASTNGPAIEITRGTLRLTLAVTVPGTSLDITLQTRRDADDTWRSLGTFAQKTTATSERKCFPGCDREVRVVSTIVGGPSTFKISGDAV